MVSIGIRQQLHQSYVEFAQYCFIGGSTLRVSIIFSTIYVYNSSQFIELLLSQPIARGKIWLNILSDFPPH